MPHSICLILVEENVTDFMMRCNMCAHVYMLKPTIQKQEIFL